MTGHVISIFVLVCLVEVLCFATQEAPEDAQGADLLWCAGGVKLQHLAVTFI